MVERPRVPDSGETGSQGIPAGSTDGVGPRTTVGRGLIVVCREGDFRPDQLTWALAKNAEIRYAGLCEDYQTVLGRRGLSAEQRAGLWANLVYHRRVLAAIRQRRIDLANAAASRPAGVPPRRAGHWRD